MLDLTDKQEIQDLYSRFFNTLYDKDTLSGGGQPVPMDMNPVQELDIMINHDTGEKINIFMTVPPIPYYESSVEHLNILLERLKTLRNDPQRFERIAKISADLERVRQNINLYYNRELEIEKEDANRPDSVEAPEVVVEDELMEINENTVTQNITEPLPFQNTTNAKNRKTLKRSRNNNNNNNNSNQHQYKRARPSNRKSRYANNKTYRKK
jgi:hypothetical protein